MWFYKPDDTCCDCDVNLGDDRVFGMCRPCAEARHAARQARKMLRKVVAEHKDSPDADR
jgi:hypothetical protein